MWSSRNVLALALLLATPAAAQVACPASLHHHPIRDIGLFVGPPEEMGEQMGGPDGWDVNVQGEHLTKPAYYVQCRFAGTKETVSMPGPLTAKWCALRDTKALQMVCR